MSSRTQIAAAGAVASLADAEYVLLGIPDVHGSIRGKALRPDAFEAALREGTVMTDLILALDPTDTPITDYETFGIRSGAGDLVVHPEPDTLRELSWRLGWRVCLATPSWSDGSACEISSREVLRRALDDLAELGYSTLAAFEYEIRLRDGEGQPLSTFNFASDANPHKNIARGMIRMVQRLNGQDLPSLLGASEQPRVTCYTCHRGSATPETMLPPPPPRPGNPPPPPPAAPPPPGAHPGH